MAESYDSFAVFVHSMLGPGVSLMVSSHDTILSLRKKLDEEHIGEITVNAIMAERDGILYKLQDCLPLGALFDREQRLRGCFLLMKATNRVIKPHDQSETDLEKTNHGVKKKVITTKFSNQKSQSSAAGKLVKDKNGELGAKKNLTLQESDQPALVLSGGRKRKQQNEGPSSNMVSEDFHKGPVSDSVTREKKKYRKTKGFSSSEVPPIRENEPQPQLVDSIQVSEKDKDFYFPEKPVFPTKSEVRSEHFAHSPSEEEEEPILWVPDSEEEPGSNSLLPPATANPSKIKRFKLSPSHKTTVPVSDPPPAIPNPPKEKGKRLKLKSPSPSPSKKNPVQRIWSQADELLLLHALSSYRWRNARLPTNNKDAQAEILSALSGKISFPTTTNQISNKVRQMKYDYGQKRREGSRSNLIFANPHAEIVFNKCAKLFEGSFEPLEATIRLAKVVLESSYVTTGKNKIDEPKFSYIMGFIRELLREEEWSGFPKIDDLIARVGEPRLLDIEKEAKKYSIQKAQLRETSSNLTAKVVQIVDLNRN